MFVAQARGNKSLSPKWIRARSPDLDVCAKLERAWFPPPSEFRDRCAESGAGSGANLPCRQPVTIGDAGSFLCYRPDDLLT